MKIGRMRWLIRSQIWEAAGKVLIIQGLQAGDGEPAQLDAEKNHEQKRQPEMGNGKADKDDYGRHFVEPGILAGGRKNPYGDGRKENEGEGSHVDEIW